jgi:hypothetical protein
MRRDKIINKKAIVVTSILCTMLIAISFSGCVEENGKPNDISEI